MMANQMLIELLKDKEMLIELFVEASRNGDIDAMDSLWGSMQLQNISIDSFSADGLSALHNAALNEQAAAINWIIDHGGNIELRTHEDYQLNVSNNEYSFCIVEITALDIAVLRGNIMAVEALLQRGANSPYNIMDALELSYNQGDSDIPANHPDAHMNRVDNYSPMIELLLRYGVEINLIHEDGDLYDNQNGHSLLMLSIKKENLYFTKYLLKNGIDVDQVTIDGESATDVALESDNIEFIKLLYAAGARIDDYDISDFEGKADLYTLWHNSRLADNVVKSIDNENLVVKDVLGDGNCFFRALAKTLGVDQELHLDLREMAVNQMINHPELYNDIVGDINAYIDDVIDNGRWVDDTTVIQAIADARGINIRIRSLHGVRDITVEANDQDSAVTVQLLYTGNHYQAILPREETSILVKRARDGDEEVTGNTEANKKLKSSDDKDLDLVEALESLAFMESVESMSHPYSSQGEIDMTNEYLTLSGIALAFFTMHT